jgi:hypothetical protein
LIGTVRIAVHAIEMRSPTEVEPYKAWLASVAARVCHATKPSAGRIQATRDEQDTIDRLSAVLGVARGPCGRPPRMSPDTTCARPTPAPLPSRVARISTRLLLIGHESQQV